VCLPSLPSRARVRSSVGLEYTIPRAQWQPEQPRCTRCGSEFTFINRVHHCRRCGRCVCGDCSTKSHDFPGHPMPQRVCDECDRNVVRQRHWIEFESLEIKHNVPFNTDAIEVHYVPKKGAPIPAYLWLSGTMCLLVYQLDEEDSGSASTQTRHAIPVHQIREIKLGLCTSELEARSVTVTCGCFSSKNEEFLSRADSLFTFVLDNGTTHTFCAESVPARVHLVEMWERALEVLNPAVRFHWHNASLSVSKLMELETERLTKLKSQPMLAGFLAHWRAQLDARLKELKVGGPSSIGAGTVAKPQAQNIAESRRRRRSTQAEMNEPLLPHGGSSSSSNVARSSRKSPLS